MHARNEEPNVSTWGVEYDVFFKHAEQCIFERLDSEYYINCCLNFIVFYHSYIRRRYIINTTMDFNNDAIMPNTKKRYPSNDIHITMEIIETALHRVSKAISLWVPLSGFYARK